MIGKKVSNYIIKEFIAEGGMGSVYLCEHETIGWKAAVKILHPEFAANKEVLERFKREAKTLSELKHSNIVEILDFGVSERKAFLIMEFIEGQPLNEYIEKVSGPINEEDTINIMCQILNAIQLAHDKGIIHRDLKPSNIIINEKKGVKILDFGIAKKLGNNDLLKTSIGQKLGTLPYMSPEQIKGASNINKATDIYSLGVLLHQMVTGKPPYSNELSEYDISKNVVENKLPRINEIYPNAKEYFQQIIDKATEKDIEKRYKSVSDLKNALKEETLKNKKSQETNNLISKIKNEIIKDLNKYYNNLEEIRSKIELLTSSYNEQLFSKLEYENKIKLLRNEEKHFKKEIEKSKDILKKKELEQNIEKKIIEKITPKLNKLLKLLNSELITKEEFEIKKAEIYRLEKDKFGNVSRIYEKFDILDIVEQKRKSVSLLTRREETNLIIELQEEEERLLDLKKLCPYCKVLYSISNNICRNCGEEIE